MRIASLLLAAGAGHRFGGCKQLAPVDGKPLVRHALEALAPLFSEHLYIVLGAFGEEIRPRVEDLAQVISHGDWRQGMGSSIARGVAEIETRGSYAGILIALADQPRLTTDDFLQLVERFDGNRIVAAHYAGAPGVPAIFPAAAFADLRRLRGDRGAKSMLVDPNRQIDTLPLPAAATDIDTEADIDR
jgi:CTP:molybdopterin cytidylyltransferase MocA